MTKRDELIALAERVAATAERHVESAENGGDLGWGYRVDEHTSVWCGEISTELWQKEEAEEVGSDAGFWLVAFDTSLARDDQARVIGRVAEHRAREAALVYALGLAVAKAANPAQDPRDAG